jgi:hypothetical protein
VGGGSGSDAGAEENGGVGARKKKVFVGHFSWAVLEAIDAVSITETITFGDVRRNYWSRRLGLYIL